jgi:hypothetical protein
MNRIYIPTADPHDWRRLLAAPEKHWRTGYSAKALSHCWEAADGFPPEIARLFSKSGIPELQGIEPLIIMPEHQVPLPGGARPSQNDLFVLAKAQGHLVSMTVEGKVSEPFGQSIEEWLKHASSGKLERLPFLKDRLGLTQDLPSHIRYQLLHRTASAVIEAVRFTAKIAVMIVHSFSQEDTWFEDYKRFVMLYGPRPVPNQLVFLTETQGVRLYSGWVRGEARWLTA